MSEFEKLASKIQSCAACDLSRLDVNKKYGKLTMTGHATSAILFVGQNPSCYRNETSDHKSFVGRTSGNFFRNLLNQAGFDDKKVFITNLIKCSTAKNIIPSAKTLETCIYWFNREVELVKPKLIVGLGVFVKKFFDGVQNELTDWHGYKVFCTYHPAYVKYYGNVDEFKKILRRIKEIYDEMKFTQVRLSTCLS